jgi:outer membrane lipoprotein LolB
VVNLSRFSSLSNARILTVMPMPKLPLIRLLPLVSLVLSACTLPSHSPAGNPDSAQWRQHVAQVQHLSSYQTRGSFAYLSDKQKVYAHFFWQQYAPNNYKLLLTNPLGSTEMELKVKNGIAQLTNNQGKQYTSDNPDDMISKLTGMDIPLENLRLWMLGLPGEDSHFTLDSQYQLKQVTYSVNGTSGQVDYDSYDPDTYPSLPHSLEMSQTNQRIKLKMDSWTLH